MILALVARAKAAAVDANEQRRGAVAFHKPKVKLVPRVRAVGDVHLRWLEHGPIGLAVALEFLKRLRLGEREHAVLVGIGRGIALEDVLKVCVGLGGRFRCAAEHGRKQKTEDAVHAGSLPEIRRAANGKSARIN